MSALVPAGRVVLALVAVLAAVACSGGGGGGDGGDGGEGGDAGALPVVVVALDHPPVQAVMGDVERVLGEFGARLRVRRLDAESEQGRDFAEDNGVTGHVAMAIFVDGSPEARVDGRTVRFVGFPHGRGPVPVAEGEWTLDELRAALAERVAP